MHPPKRRPQPLHVAGIVVDTEVPERAIALLAGSFVRGDATPRSDLDIVVVGAGPAYRESLIAQGYPVELFVHNRRSLEHFFAADIKRLRPSLLRMVAESVVVRDQHGGAAELQARAQERLLAGPGTMTRAECDARRYAVTDRLDDLEGASDAAERLLIGQTLARGAAELWLLSQGQWLGQGKWLVRMMRLRDPATAEALVAALRRLAEDESGPLIAFAEAVLRRTGGRLFAGFRLAAPVGSCSGAGSGSS